MKTNESEKSIGEEEFLISMNRNNETINHWLATHNIDYW